MSKTIQMSKKDAESYRVKFQEEAFPIMNHATEIYDAFKLEKIQNTFLQSIAMLNAQKFISTNEYDGIDKKEMDERTKRMLNRITNAIDSFERVYDNE
jgi:hypothetical protein